MGILFIVATTALRIRQQLPPCLWLLCPRGKRDMGGLLRLNNCFGLEVTHATFYSQFIGQNMSHGPPNHWGAKVSLLRACKGRELEIFVKRGPPFTEHLSRARHCAQGFLALSPKVLNNPWEQGLLSSVNTWATWHSEIWKKVACSTPHNE